MSMSNESKTAVQFKTLYEQWEQYLKARFGKSEMRKLSRKFWEEEFAKCKKERVSENELLGLVNIRNAHIHSSLLLEIKPQAVILLRKLVNTFCKRAKDIATPGSKIYKVDLKAKARNVILKMNKNLYTHVPIVKEKKFYGVFSENTLLKIIASGRWKERIKINDIKDLLKENEGTDNYRFLSADANFYDIYQLFQEHIDLGRRLGVIFLSKKGKQSGQINGLITAWDLHKGEIP